MKNVLSHLSLELGSPADGFNGATHHFRDSNSPLPYNQHSTIFDLETCGREGGSRISVRVNGYWSSDVINIYIRRQTSWLGHADEFTADWRIEVSHSSGGRLTETSQHYTEENGYYPLADDLDAEGCFGHALVSAAALGRRIRAEVFSLEHWYQVAKAGRKAKEDEEKAALAARIIADLPIGMPAAKSILNAARAAATNGAVVKYDLYDRGMDTPSELVCAKLSRFITWTHRGNRVNEEKVLDLLANASIRTNVAS